MGEKRRIRIWGSVFLISFLVLGMVKIILLERSVEEGEYPGATEHGQKVMKIAENVWILGRKDGGLSVFEEGEEKSYSLEEALQSDEACSEVLADLVLFDNQIVQIHKKTQKISGKLLSADSGGIELEGKGRLSFSQKVKGYRLYGRMQMCGYKDLLIGYDSADFVVEDGEICGILMVKEEAMQSIRVLISTTGYQSLFHRQAEFGCDTAYTVSYGEGSNGSNGEEHFQAGEVFNISCESDRFLTGRIQIRPDVLTGKVSINSVERNQGIPCFRGFLELVLTEEGMVIINELPLEEYLYSVVPSEMPASFPKEALKAQAVCARTYAYGHMLHAAYPGYGAHVDDSTSYQVYNNIAEQENAVSAVRETYGELLYTGDMTALANTYYYSTSCGAGSDAGAFSPVGQEQLSYLKPEFINRSAWIQKTSTGKPMGAEELSEEETFRQFILQTKEEDYEKDEGWYRWSYVVEKADENRMLSVLQKRYRSSPGLILTYSKEKNDYVSQYPEKLGKLKDIAIVKRGAGGVAQELVLTGEEETIKVLSEYNIRCVLNDGKTKVCKQDGKEVLLSSLLPSAFFIIETGKEGENVVGYTITGGGFGHGVGMSQNAAGIMARDGFSAGEILSFFYPGCILCNVYQIDRTSS